MICGESSVTDCRHSRQHQDRNVYDLEDLSAETVQLNHNYQCCVIAAYRISNLSDPASPVSARNATVILKRIGQSAEFAGEEFFNDLANPKSRKPGAHQLGLCRVLDELDGAPVRSIIFIDRHELARSSRDISPQRLKPG